MGHAELSTASNTSGRSGARETMRVVISEFMDPAAVALLAARFDTAFDPEMAERREPLKRLIAEADALIVRNKTQVDGELLAAAPRLKVLGRLGVGLDNIDVLTCKSRGIEVIPATGANALAVAEYVIAAAMILLRGAYTSTEAVAAGKWPRGATGNGRELSGKTLGVVGFGQIGQLTGRLARALGMKVIGFDAVIPADNPMWSAERTAPRKFDELLREADVISIHVPLTPATRGLIDAGKLALMKADAVLINTSRGQVVNEAVLAAALRAGKLGGAALDVFEHEPLASGTPLAECPRLLLTPHIAGVTRESNVRVSTMIAEKVAAALDRHRA
jgi:(S)-sulfolactate dehydrogenase